MDIIAMLLARAMTPQGKTETYVAKANAAAAKAEKAEQDATTAIASVTAAASNIAEAQSAATNLLADAREALATAQEAQLNMDGVDIEEVDTEIKKMRISRSQVTSNSNEYYENLHVTYPDGTGYVIPNTVSLHKNTGTSEASGMTQKAITEALATKANAADLNSYATTAAMTTALADKADKTYVDQQIASIPSGGGNGNINGNITAEDEGHIVVIGPNGEIISSTITEDSVLEALLQNNAYVIEDAIGLDIDYVNRTFTRVQGAVNKSAGADFNEYTMYGGRTKCNVLDDGTITAFYGDNNYTEDGSNGQVMIYQPKFYYKRIIREAEQLSRGFSVHHETLLLSTKAQTGFKLAPIFREDLEYVLLPAYNGSLVDNKLSSIAGAEPVISLSIEQAENYAKARGTGWHITNLAAEATNQMLEMVEFGTMNGQLALEQGITNFSDTNGICYSITGSTAALGNGTGNATTTRVKRGDSITDQTDDGYRAIAYRGMENPWGNLWTMIGGLNIVGNGSQNGGIPYVCTDFNYTLNGAGNNYADIGFNMPSVYGWINAMGYGNADYDWAYIPSECHVNATSFAPVGDRMWTIAGLNDTNIAAVGGSFSHKEACGPFYYAMDRTMNEAVKNNYSAKLLYIPTKNATYTANIIKWQTYMGG